MINEQLRDILSEYPMSRRLVVIVHREPLLETTVVEMITKLMEQSPTASLTFFGYREMILRERAEDETRVKWLEMDMR